MRKPWRIKWVWSFLGLEEQAVTVHCLAQSCACFPSSSLPEVGLCWPQITQQSTQCHIIHTNSGRCQAGVAFPSCEAVQRQGLLWSTLTPISPALCLSLSLLVILMDSIASDFAQQWPKQGSKSCGWSSRACCEAGLPQRLQVSTEPDPCVLSVTASSHPETLNSQQGQPNPR